MFTIGIFSTHIPYIAFGLFYVFLFAADIYEVIPEENKTDETYTKSGLCTYETLTRQQYDTFNYYAKILNTGKINHSEKPIFEQIIKYPDFTFANTCNNYSTYSLFSRPPPVV